MFDILAIPGRATSGSNAYGLDDAVVSPKFDLVGLTSATSVVDVLWQRATHRLGTSKIVALWSWCTQVEVPGLVQLLLQEKFVAAGYLKKPIC